VKKIKMGCEESEKILNLLKKRKFSKEQKTDFNKDIMDDPYEPMLPDI
jgi:hypothetical protein